MTLVDRYEVYFRRPNEAVVYAAAPDLHEVSLLHRNADGGWHCALCNTTRCPHAEAAETVYQGRRASA